MPGDKGGKTKHDRCVEHVKESSPEVTNPHAVCVAHGVYPEKWKKSLKKASDAFESNIEIEELTCALEEAHLEKSAMNLKIWDELDQEAVEFIDDLTKSINDKDEHGEDDDDKDDDLEKKYIGFKKLKRKVAHKKGVYNAGGLAGFIARDKYGDKKVQMAAAKGKKMKGMHVKKSEDENIQGSEKLDKIMDKISNFLKNDVLKVLKDDNEKDK